MNCAGRYHGTRPILLFVMQQKTDRQKAAKLRLIASNALKSQKNRFICKKTKKILAITLNRSGDNPINRSTQF